MDEPEEPVEEDSGQQISDVDSEFCQEDLERVPSTHVSHVETPSLSVSLETSPCVLVVAVMRVYGH